MNLFEIVEEGCDALQSGLALTLNLDLELDFSLADTTQVLDVVQLGNQSYATACDNGLTEAHVVHAVVDQHLDVVNFDNLVPHVGQQ